MIPVKMRTFLQMCWSHQVQVQVSHIVEQTVHVLLARNILAQLACLSTERIASI